MATGGKVDTDVDSRVTCSVCLEEYKGRQPKLLPCFHTFCLPCLNQLTCTNHGDSQGGTQATVTCPTCRSVHCLPPGGASTLQTNFYIDHSSPTGTGTDVAMATQVDSDPSDDLQTKVKEQVKVLETVISRLSEEEKEIERQRKVMELDVRQRYEIGLRALEECREQCVSSVAQVSGQLMDKLQADLLFAHSLLKPLHDLAGSTPLTSDPTSRTHPALLTDAVLRHFRQQAARCQHPPPTLFLYSCSDNMADLADSFRRFMGTVVPSGGGGAPPQSASSGGGKKAGERTGDHSCGFQGGDSDALLSQDRKVRALETAMQQMQTENERLGRELTSLKQSMTGELATVKTDLPAVRVHVANLQTEQSTVRTQVDSLRRDVAAMRGDVTTTTADMGKLQKNIAAVEKDTSKTQQSQDQMDSVITKLQSQIDKITTPVFFMAKLTEDTSLKKNEIVKLDKVVSNEGAGYDASTGKFTAPCTGTYLFLATGLGDRDQTCLKASKKYAAFNIVVNTQRVVTAWTRGPTSSTAHAVVTLQSGDQVCMAGLNGSDEYSFRGDEFTSFCGVLMHPHN